MGWDKSDVNLKTEWDASKVREMRSSLLVKQEQNNQRSINRLKMVETQEEEDGKKVINYYLPKDSSQTVMTEDTRNELITKLIENIHNQDSE